MAKKNSKETPGAFVVLDTTLQHDGKSYNPGDTLDITDTDTSSRLVACGAIADYTADSADIAPAPEPEA